MSDIERCKGCGDRLGKDGSCTTCQETAISDATQGVLDATDAWYEARRGLIAYSNRPRSEFNEAEALAIRGAFDRSEEALAAAVDALGRAYAGTP